jgi:hypothetical protein
VNLENASSPTTSVDALVHVNAYGDRKNGAAVHYPLRLDGASSIWKFGLQSFKRGGSPRS